MAIYMWREGWTPGIYHDTVNGLISLSSDGVNWITIADKNLGATVVWNNGDSLTQNNVGNMFQWGNNYGFPYTNPTNIDNGQISTAGYGPGNYYSSNVYRPGSNNIFRDWSNPKNDNLWGGETGTVEAMRGPCQSGFHIPSYNDLTSLYDILDTFGILGNTSIYLKIPLSGVISPTQTGATINADGYYSYIWSATTYNNDVNIFRVWTGQPSIEGMAYESRTTGCIIRPFKNDVVMPDNSWTVLYQPN